MTDEISALPTAWPGNEDQWNRLNSVRELIEHETRLEKFEGFQWGIPDSLFYLEFTEVSMILFSGGFISRFLDFLISRGILFPRSCSNIYR